MFISILTFSDLDIALSSTADSLFLDCGLLPEFNYTPVTVLMGLFTVACLYFLVATIFHWRICVRVCVKDTDGHTESVLFILGRACTQVDVPVTSSSF